MKNNASPKTKTSALEVFRFVARPAATAGEGFLLSFFAYLAIVPIPEATLLWLSNATFTPLEIGASLSLYALGAFLFSLTFGLIFHATRVLGALTSRFSYLWARFSTGLCAFFLLGEQPARLFLLTRGTEEAQGFASFLVFPIFLVLATALLYLFPRFRGMNWTFILGASLLSRFIVSPLRVQANSDVWDPILYTGVFALIWATLYFALHIRYRRIRLESSEATPIPASAFFWIGSGLFIGLVFFLGALHLNPGHLTRAEAGLLGALTFICGLGLIFLFQWLLESLWVIRAASREGKYQTTSLLSSLGATLLALASFLFLQTHPISPELRGKLIRNSVWAGELLALDTLFRNASPGPASLRAAYASAGRSNGFPGKGREDHPAHYARNEHKKKKRSLLLVTLIGKPGQDDPVAALRSKYRFDSNVILFSRDEPGGALADLFAQGDGNTTHSRRSIFSVYASKGYRTICLGWDGGRAYLSLKHPARLDRGCQIYLPREIKSAFPRPTRVYADLHWNYKKYREKRNLLWLHYDANDNSLENRLEKWKSALRPGNLQGELNAKPTPSVPTERDREKRKTPRKLSLDKLPEKWDALIVYAPGPFPRAGRAYYNFRKKQGKRGKLPPSKKTQAKRTQAPRASGEHVPVALNPARNGRATRRHRPSWVLAFVVKILGRKPEIHYALQGNRVVYLDLLTGATWQEDVFRP